MALATKMAGDMVFCTLTKQNLTHLHLGVEPQMKKAITVVDMLVLGVSFLWMAGCFRWISLGRKGLLGQVSPIVPLALIPISIGIVALILVVHFVFRRLNLCFALLACVFWLISAVTAFAALREILYVS